VGIFPSDLENLASENIEKALPTAKKKNSFLFLVK
jgi:hypothetical protein